ncbi:MAG: AAA family ATPase [Luteibaculaceae bacterium]
MSAIELNPQFEDLKPEAIINHVNDLKSFDTENSNRELSNSEILCKIKLDLTEDVPPPDYCLFMGSEGSELPICSLGDFSFIQGKAKSRKSFLVADILGAIVKNGRNNYFKGYLPENKRTVLYFDTEQSRYHISKAANRVTRLAKDKNPKNLIVYPLRKFNPSERLKLIDYAIYNTPNLGFVVIDGIRDLVKSINDEAEATEINSKLLKWTEELNIHILTVIHQNKGNNNVRGHIGTELQNKTQLVLEVAKDEKNDEISIVEPKESRDKQAKGFAFKINESGLPEPVEDWELKKEKYDTQKGITPLGLTESTHLQIIDTTFKSNKKPKISELVSNAKTAFEVHGKKMGNTKVKDFINHWVNTEYINKIGKDRSPIAYYELNPEYFNNLLSRVLPN